MVVGGIFGAWTEAPLNTDALKAITGVTATLQHSLIRLENLQKLTELQRDLVGVENLIAPGRVSGCVLGKSLSWLLFCKAWFCFVVLCFVLFCEIFMHLL